MNQVLYEASYIGSSKAFLTNVLVVAGLTLGAIACIFATKRERRIEKENSTKINEKNYKHIVNDGGFPFGALFLGINALIIGIGLILGYTQVILGYKRGKYREVQGIVEDYTDRKNGYTFTIEGVEFEVSMAVVTWGYVYSYDKNVITGDGQHLKIRYIPGLNSIVYIEEIGPPLTGTDDTEEDIEEPAVPIDQVEIQGRTEEETELIRKILSQDKKEFQRFLMADWGYPYKEAIWISAYDFTGDGRDEILVSKYHVDLSAELTYNYVYDQTGRKVLEFVSGGDTQIIDGWDGSVGVNELTKTKEYVREDEKAEEYKQLFEESETTGFSRIGMIRYSESDGFKEYTEED